MSHLSVMIYLMVSWQWYSAVTSFPYCDVLVVLLGFAIYRIYRIFRYRNKWVIGPEDDANELSRNRQLVPGELEEQQGFECR